jgi:3-isopropylmalate dehydrogenase
VDRSRRRGAGDTRIESAVAKDLESRSGAASTVEIGDRIAATV